MSGFTAAWLALSIPGIRQVPKVPPKDVTLGDDWKSFETLLGQFKNEYTRVKHEYTRTEAEFDLFMKDIHALELAVEQLTDPEMRASIETMIRTRLESSHHKEFTEKLGTLGGTLKAMMQILQSTNADRYNEFTCPVCMDKRVEMFMDPCGHVICSTCFIRLHESKCPTCRSTVTAKRMYPTF